MYNGYKTYIEATAHKLGERAALTQARTFLPGLLIPKYSTPVHNAVKKGFFDTLGLVDDEQDNSLINKPNNGK